MVEPVTQPAEADDADIEPKYDYGSKIPWDEIKFKLGARKRKKVVVDVLGREDT